ncbi:tetratricopeptide repeat protein [Bradyrhizobium sp. ISRA463]|uniref:tetratricopeptide repeat protein n=1 Tax=Bradyrhizobium sp. ISRA463 TaxID=2866199 RepID=UPI00247923C0|nr:tetratricopeptide repeat protein [Bradyrhizobium sp. ISRA463]WGS19561.1 hypothetical protein MTX22_35180 [Bradyrhizobium sp. ISRA463]
MSRDNAEDIVRRATAAFNAGRHDEAIGLCERGLAREPGEPMLSHLLAAVRFAKGEIAPARTHIETSLARRPNNVAARLLAARIARAGGEFDAALTHLDRAIALSRSAMSLSRRRARSSWPAGKRKRARPGRRSSRSSRSIRKQPQGSAGWRGRMATSRTP